MRRPWLTSAHRRECRAGSAESSIFESANDVGSVMSEAQWHYTRGGAQQAAVSFAELQQLAQSGALGRSDLVWSAGMPQWIAAESVTNLFSAGAAPPPL